MQIAAIFALLHLLPLLLLPRAARALPTLRGRILGLACVQPGVQPGDRPRRPRLLIMRL